MAELTIVYDETDMAGDEQEEFLNQIRELVHEEWGHISASVIGPTPPEPEVQNVFTPILKRR